MEHITESNRLIAEFLGARRFQVTQEFEMYGIIPTIEDGENEKHFFRGDEMKFHTSWDWLMLVVGKVDLISSVLIGRFFCDIKYIDPLDNTKHFEIRIASGVKMNAIYGAITEFIQWYNQNKQS